MIAVSRSNVGLEIGSRYVPRHMISGLIILCDRYTASFAFFEALWSAGVTHVFVNLGSDHPSIIEAIVKGQNEKKGHFPRIITCPNEVCFLTGIFLQFQERG